MSRIDSNLLPNVEITEGLPPGAVDLLKAYIAGGVGTMEFTTRMEAIRARAKAGSKDRISVSRPQSTDPLQP